MGDDSVGDERLSGGDTGGGDTKVQREEPESPADTPSSESPPGGSAPVEAVQAEAEAIQDEDGAAEESPSCDDPIEEAAGLGDGGNELPWRSEVENAKEFFSTELLYRFDILEEDERAFLAGSYRLELKGYRGGVWTLNLGDDIDVINRKENANVVLTMDQRDFLEIVNGNLNPQLCLVSKKVRIKGDVEKVTAFQALLSPPRE